MKELIQEYKRRDRIYLGFRRGEKIRNLGRGIQIEGKWNRLLHRKRKKK